MTNDSVWKPHLTVAAIAVRGDRYLMVEEESGGRRVFNQPAGHVDEGERIVDACSREALEETGWSVNPESLVGIYRWVNPATEETMVRICFACNGAEQQAPGPLDDSIVRAVWMTETELEQERDRMRSPLVLRCIRDYQAGSRYELDLLQDLE